VTTPGAIEPSGGDSRRTTSAWETTQAHHGVVFLDEVLQLGARVLAVMRQLMEDDVVTISGAQGTLTFPAKFTLVGALNPCPCWAQIRRLS